MSGREKSCPTPPLGGVNPDGCRVTGEGRHLSTHPVIESIHFLDVDRTMALVGIRVRYRGGEATLSRFEAGWELEDVKFTWME